jgi:hypothetical protein
MPVVEHWEARVFFWQQIERGTNAGWCISEKNHSHLLEKIFFC